MLLFTAAAFEWGLRRYTRFTSPQLRERATGTLDRLRLSAQKSKGTEDAAEQTTDALRDATLEAMHDDLTERLQVEPKMAYHSMAQP